MTVANMAELLRDARSGGYAIGAFNVVTIETAEGIIAGAQDARCPVVVQVSENTSRYHGGLEGIGAACVALAMQAPVPVIVHLDHAQSLELCQQAAALGFDSVMFDGSMLPFEENVRRTCEVAAWARRAGLTVEAELGHVAGKATDTGEATLTDPVRASEFVAATHVDSLAVAVGTAHHMTTTTATLDVARIRALRAAVGVPLVLHGSSGLDEKRLREGVIAGIAKVNIATELNIAFTGALRETLSDRPELHDPRPYLQPAREAVRRAVAHKLAVLSAGAGTSAGRPGH